MRESFCRVIQIDMITHRANTCQATNREISRQDGIRRALQSLGDTLTEIAKSAESKRGERCPYRSAKDECTFKGGCINKRRQTNGTKLCGGDHKLKWK